MAYYFESKPYALWTEKNERKQILLLSLNGMQTNISVRASVCAVRYRFFEIYIKHSVRDSWNTMFNNRTPSTWCHMLISTHTRSNPQDVYGFILTLGCFRKSAQHGVDSSPDNCVVMIHCCNVVCCSYWCASIARFQYFWFKVSIHRWRYRLYLLPLTITLISTHVTHSTHLARWKFIFPNLFPKSAFEPLKIMKINNIPNCVNNMASFQP